MSKPIYVRIAEWFFGRPVLSGEDVHHIDFNHTNDDPDNLWILSHGEHMRLHMLGNKYGLVAYIPMLLRKNCVMLRLVAIIQRKLLKD